jgi:hypothetical protein
MTTIVGISSLEVDRNCSLPANFTQPKRRQQNAGHYRPGPEFKLQLAVFDTPNLKVEL